MLVKRLTLTGIMVIIATLYDLVSRTFNFTMQFITGSIILSSLKNAEFRPL